MTTPESPRTTHSAADEALSAFIDGQCDELERRRVAARLLDDADARAAFRRYHLQAAVLRGDPALAADAEADAAALQRLRNALALEPTWGRPEQPATLPPSAAEDAAQVMAESARVAALAGMPPRRSRAWYGAGLGIATAAGLAAGVFFAPGAGTLPAQPTPAIAAVAAPLDGAVVATGSIDTRRLAHRYMLLHAQQSGLSQAAQGIPMVKYVSFTPEGRSE